MRGHTQLLSRIMVQKTRYVIVYNLHDSQGSRIDSSSGLGLRACGVGLRWKLDLMPSSMLGRVQVLSETHKKSLIMPTCGEGPGRHATGCKASFFDLCEDIV